MKAHATPDQWYDGREAWRDELAALRLIVLGTGLAETLKWKQPCYTDRDKNIVIIGQRKHCALVSFLKGALLDDPRGCLVQPGQERSGRYMRFTSVTQVERDRSYLHAMIHKAIEAERAGLRVAPLPAEIDYVAELQQRLDADEALRVAFEGLTPGRRRGYNLHFARSNKSSTREARITRCQERILLGRGLLDCVCGHSKRPPGCDGSHKALR